MTEQILLGAVIAAHGIKGEVRVKTFTLAPENLDAYGPLVTKDGRHLKIASLRLAKPGEAIVAFAEIADRNAAERLKGTQLFVSRAQLPALEAGEYYFSDLIGLRAEDHDGKALGIVRAVHNFGAGDIVEIELSGGIEFIPLNQDHVTLVDIAGGRMVVAMPPEAQEV